MLDLIVIAGAPGSGKTTISNLLSAYLDSPLIDLGHIRQFHLNPAWTNASEDEELMSFENLVFMVHNYVKHGYGNVIVNDLMDYRVQETPKHFNSLNYLIITLILKDESELKRRVLIPERDSGFRDYRNAIEWNRSLFSREIENEIKVENSTADIESIMSELKQLIDTKNKA